MGKEINIVESYDLIKLKQIADFETTEKVFKRLKKEEGEELKNSLAIAQIYLNKRNNAIKAFKEAMASLDTENALDVISKMEVIDFGEKGTKALKSEIQLIVNMLEEEGSTVEETVYGIKDYEQEMVFIYDSSGYYSYHRPMTPEEKMSPSMFNNTLKKVENGK